MSTEPDNSRNSPMSFRRFCFRWHYRLGLLAVPVVLLLAVTGLLLNHSAALKLHKAPLEGTWLASWYEADIAASMTWDQWLLDMHTGRFFGTYGPYVMDAAAVFLLLLALSGAYNWARRIRKW